MILSSYECERKSQSDVANLILLKVTTKHLKLSRTTLPHNIELQTL